MFKLLRHLKNYVGWLLLAFVLLVLALCAGLLISYFTYQPVMQMSPGWAFSIPPETSSRR